MKRLTGRKSRGFTLVELVIVMGMLAAVMAAVYGVYEVHQRSAYTQDEVVEVQQSLRIAMDQMTRDIRNAGILVPKDPPPPLYAVTLPAGDGTGISGTDILFLNTASVSGKYAVIDSDCAKGTTAFKVSASEEVDKFQMGDTVKIVRVGSNLTEPPWPGAPFSVTKTDRATRTITILTSGVAEDYDGGDVIVGTTEADRPETIRYCVGPGNNCAVGLNQCPANQACLVRLLNKDATGSVIATNITDFQVSYLLQGNLAETSSPTDSSLIRGIRIRLVGSTALTGTRQRELNTVVNLRNGVY